MAKQIHLRLQFTSTPQATEPFIGQVLNLLARAGRATPKQIHEAVGSSMKYGTMYGALVQLQRRGFITGVRRYSTKGDQRQYKGTWFRLRRLGVKQLAAWNSARAAIYGG